MSFIFNLALLIGSFMTYPNLLPDCSNADFIGTWKGKVVYEGSELAQGPYTIEYSEDGSSLELKDEKGTVIPLEKNGCDVSYTLDVEGTMMTTKYTLEDSNLLIESRMKLTLPDGKAQEIVLEGSLTKE